jgi:hypothetical protein
MLVIAILDNAFESCVKSAEDVFRLRVKAPRNSYQLKWKEKVQKIPIFRQAVFTASGVQTSDPSEPKALRYHTYLYYLQRIGLLTGFPQLLCPYDTRRGAGEAVDGMYIRQIQTPPPSIYTN